MSNVPTLSLQGWGLQRVSGGKEWKPRWMAIQHCTLLWFLDESSQMPEDVISLAGCKYKRTGELLDKGEEVISIMCKGRGTAIQTVYIAVNSYESPMWTSAIKIHTEATVDISDSIEETLEASLEDYLDEVEPVTGEVSFNKVPRYITVGLEDDTSACVTQFLEQYAPKRVDQYHTSVENVVLKLLLESCVIFQDRQRKQMGSLRRKLTGVIAAEQRALAAEEHASHISNSISVMEKNVEILTQNLASSKEASDNKTMEISRLTRLLQEAGLAINETYANKEKLVTSEAKLANTETDLEGYKRQVASLEKELEGWKKTDTATLRKELAHALKELKEARRQKAGKEKATQEAKRETEKAYQELRIMYGVQAGRRPSAMNLAVQDAPGSPAAVDMEGARAIAVLTTEKAALQGEKQALEETLANLQQRLALEVDAAVAGREAAEEEALRLATELEQWQNSPLTERVTSLGEENRTLREQIIKQHQEVVRLTRKLEDVRGAAVEAVKLLNTLQPDGRVMEMLSKAMSSTTRSVGHVPPANQSGFVGGVSRMGSPGGKPLTSQMLATSPARDVALMEPSSSSAPMIAARENWDIFADTPYIDDIMNNAGVRLNIFHKLYEKYTNDNNVITHSRFIRFAKEYLLTPHSSGASVQHIKPQHSPMLVAGDIDLIFKAAIKTDPEDRKAPFGTGPRMFVRRSQTSAASNMVFHQFIQAISMLARKLYATVVEERYGTSLEYLTLEQREPAVQEVIVVLIKGKVLGGMARQNMIPFPLFFMERSCLLLEEQRGIFNTLAATAGNVAKWFSMYADIRAPGSLDDDAASGMSFKAVLRFCQDFGVTPFLARESQLYSLFEEVLVWRRSEGERILHIMPGPLMQLVGTEVAELATPIVVEQQKLPRTAALGFPSAIAPSSLRNMKLEAHKGTIGMASFGLFMTLVALQGFAQHDEDGRLENLIDWMAKSAGGVQ